MGTPMSDRQRQQRAAMIVGGAAVGGLAIIGLAIALSSGGDDSTNAIDVSSDLDDELVDHDVVVHVHEHEHHDHARDAPADGALHGTPDDHHRADVAADVAHLADHGGADDVTTDHRPADHDDEASEPGRAAGA